MSQNKIIDDLGVPDDRPLEIDPPSAEIIQGAISGRLISDAMSKAINYETMPLICENLLATIVMDLFEQDAIYPFISGDPERSQIFISTTWSRSALKNRIALPKVLVAFQGSQPEEEVIGNLFGAAGVNQPTKDTKGLVDTSSFRITVLHQNRTIALFLGSQIRAAIAGAMDLIKMVFRVHKIYPPSLSGPGNFEELEDLFGVFIDLRIMTMPKWEQRNRPEYISKIVLSTIANAGAAVNAGLIQENVTVPDASQS